MVTMSATAQHRNCGAMNHYQIMLQNDPELAQRMAQQEIEIQQWIENRAQSKTEDEVIRIPVVVHVLYKTNIQNISDAQVYSQIEALNRDYNKLNADTVNVPSIYKNLVAKVGIEFCMAQQDPDGNWTNGITRTSTNKSTFELGSDQAKYNNTGGHDAWDATKYFNVWVVPGISESGMTGILGYAQFPGGNLATDGVVIDYLYFGTTGTATYPYDEGRTLTHETGHWLNLYHIWGDDYGSCSGSDNVSDTPNQGDENYDCPNHPQVSCSNNGDLFMNYMDYTSDICMAMFTEGQKARMLAVMNGTRASIKNSGRCLPNALSLVKTQNQIKIFPNPAQHQIQVEWLQLNTSSSIEIQLSDLSGRLLISQSLRNQSQTQLDVSRLAQGMYLITWKQGAQVHHEKVLIQH